MKCAAKEPLFLIKGFTTMGFFKKEMLKLTIVICMKEMSIIPNSWDRKFTDNRNFGKTEIGDAGKNTMLS